MFRLNEAIEYAQLLGRVVNKKSLVRSIFSYEAGYAYRLKRFDELATGEKNVIRLNYINIICDYLGVTPDFLFGYVPNAVSIKKEHILPNKWVSYIMDETKEPEKQAERFLSLDTPAGFYLYDVNVLSRGDKHTKVTIHYKRKNQ